MGSSTSDIRKMLLATSMSRSEIAAHLGIPYQYVYRVEKDFPYPRPQMQAEYQATGGGSVDIAKVVASVRSDEHREPEQLHQMRIELYQVGFEIASHFIATATGAIRGDSMKACTDHMFNGIRRTESSHNIPSRLEVLEELYPVDWQRTHRTAFRSDEDKQLYDQLLFAREAIGGLVALLKFPRPNDSDIIKNRREDLARTIRQLSGVL